LFNAKLGYSNADLWRDVSRSQLLHERFEQERKPRVHPVGMALANLSWLRNHYEAFALIVRGRNFIVQIAYIQRGIVRAIKEVCDFADRPHLALRSPAPMMNADRLMPYKQENGDCELRSRMQRVELR